MSEPGAEACNDRALGATVFISYATADRKRALQVCNALERRGSKCWISSRNVGPGENYQEAIVRALRSARAMVLIFSSAANASDEIKKELSLASRYRVPVMALRIEDIEPSDAFAYELSTRQWIDAFHGRDTAIESLAAEIERADSDGGSADPSRSLNARGSITRRNTLVVGGATAVAASGGLGWLWQSRPRLPAEARKLVDEGRDAFDDGTADGIATAIVRFRRASEIAPDHAEPWGALAIAYERQALLASTAQEADLHGRAAAARRKALAIDPDDADAVASRAMAYSVFEDWRTAEVACRAALQQHPKHAALNGWLGMLLAQVGRITDALAFVDRAIAANPRFVIAHGFRISLLEDLGRMDEADAETENTFRTWPRHYGIWFTRLYHLSCYGRAAEALAMIDDTSTRPLGIPGWNFALTRIQIQAVHTRAKADVDAAVAASLKSARQGTGFAEVAISTLGLLGQVNAAYQVIDAYFFDRGFTLPEQRFADEQGIFSGHHKRFTGLLFRRIMKPIQADARFDPLISALKLKDYWARTGSHPDYLSWLRTG